MKLLGAFVGRFGADAEDVDQRPAGVADRFENLLGAALAVVFVRRSTLRSASPLAMASGSGSLCSMISTRSASLK